MQFPGVATRMFPGWHVSAGRGDSTLPVVRIELAFFWRGGQDVVD